MEMEELFTKLSEKLDNPNKEKITELESKLAESQKRVEELTILVDTLNKRIPEKEPEAEEEKNRQEVIDFIKKM